MNRTLATIYFTLFPLLIIIPNWTVIDISGMLWFYMSILNTVFLIYIIVSNKDQNFTFLKNKVFISFLVFFLASTLSIVIAINKTESLVRITDFYCILSALFIISFFTYNRLIKPLTLLKIVLITLFIDLLGSYFQVYQVYELNMSFAEQPGNIKSFYPNKNITSFTYLIKVFLISLIPFLSNNKFLKIIVGVMNLLTLYIVFILSTRAVLFLLILIIAFIILTSLIKVKVYKHSFLELAYKLKYFLFPLFLSFIMFNLIVVNNESNINVNDRVGSVFNQTDESVSNRKRFYSSALSQIKSTPFLGIGVGNWKIKSIQWDKEYMYSYVVPYNVHNDFLEVFVETGIIGFISFLMFFYFIFIKVFKNSLLFLKENEEITSFYLLIAFIIMFVDFNLNFPFGRPSALLTYLIFISIIQSLYHKQYE